jgi:aspartyl/asparaginyl beta-hydroxylase (cupin superfamily)
MASKAIFERTISRAQHRNPPRPLIVRWGKKARKHLNRLLSRYSLVSLDPVLSPDSFPWLRHLEQAAPAIQKEAQQLLRNIAAVPPMNQMSPDHQRIAGDGGWRSFFLVGYRYRLEANCARCPETVKALSHVPGLVTALFSILEPGMHVGRHSGVSKGILIAHLGLSVPREGARCRMEVESTQVHWEEGATLVFDDTFPHEVWNDTNEHRVILLVQFERPMALIGKLLTRLLVHAVRWSPYIQDARRNVDIWETRFRTLEAQTAG